MANGLVIADKEQGIYALGLLVLNFKCDCDIIANLIEKEYERLKIEKAEFDFHCLTLGVLKIVEQNKDVRNLKILLFFYDNTTCSCCRNSIVGIMCDTDILPDYIAQECRYDCVLETRES